MNNVHIALRKNRVYIIIRGQCIVRKRSIIVTSVARTTPAAQVYTLTKEAMTLIIRDLLASSVLQCLLTVVA